MTINARNKGANGEREVCDLLQTTVDSVAIGLGMEAPRLKRNLMQFSEGGEDIVGLPWYSIEVKRTETVSLNAFWRQATIQASRKASGASSWQDVQRGGWRRLEAGKGSGGVLPPPPGLEALLGTLKCQPELGKNCRVPLVLYRQNRKPWSVLMAVSLNTVNGKQIETVASVDLQSFLSWFALDLEARLRSLV